MGRRQLLTQLTVGSCGQSRQSAVRERRQRQPRAYVLAGGESLRLELAEVSAGPVHKNVHLCCGLTERVRQRQLDGRVHPGESGLRRGWEV